MYHLAWDGQWYTKQELRQWYGEAADKIWNEAPVSKASAAEHGASSAAVRNEASTGSGAADKIWNATHGTSASAAEHGATEQSVERRICLDGVAYTKQDLRQWYGEAADKIWNEAQVSKTSAAEHGTSSSAV